MFLVAKRNWLPWQQKRKSLSQPCEDTESSNLVYGLPMTQQIISDFGFWVEFITMQHKKYHTV